jgi:predicted RNA-binding Zn-ribbon protein involved in translation (DUF1610 family)
LWCHTHGMEASAPDGKALDTCPAAWFDPIPVDQQLEIDMADGELAPWGALRPAIAIGEPSLDKGKVHVHHRPGPTAKKDVDDSYDIVRLRHRDQVLLVEGIAAVAYSTSLLIGRSMVPLTCPRCGEVHIDELKFATFPHRKHLCNSCGRNFRDTSGPSISNPLAEAHAQLGLLTPPAPRPARRLVLDRQAYGAIAIWPSNEAIVSTMQRSEEIGVHVHAWDHSGRQVIDETYSPVILDGEILDEQALRVLAVEKALVHKEPIVKLACTGCGSGPITPHDTWMEPFTSHPCHVCGVTNRTHRRSFVNPLAEK